MSEIELYGISYDPFGAAEESFSATAARYLLIRSTEPWGPPHWRALSAVGVRCLERVGEEVYLCTGDAVDLPTVRSLAFVVAVVPYPDRFKVAEALRRPEARELERRSEAGEPMTLDVTLQEEASTAEVASRLAAEGLEVIAVGRRKVRLAADARTVESVAPREEVRRVEPAPTYELCANKACELIGATRVHRDAGLRGDGETIAICDSGLDLGKLSDVHPAFTGRVEKLIPLGRRRRTNDPNGHGTHVAGLAVGDGSSVEAPGQITGTAPAARLIVQSVFRRGGLNGIPADLNDLFRPVYDEHGVRVHNNSWIEANKLGGFYSDHSREIDEFVHAHRDLVVVCATGNRGVPGAVAGSLAERTVRPPATAKNCIAVGACESPRPDQDQTWGTQTAFPDPRFDDDTVISIDGWSDDPDTVAAFSGSGPTSHDRLRPDLVAPGSVALAPRSRELGAVDPRFGASSDPGYLYSGGTSAAAPLVAGCAAVVRQHLRAELQRSPSAALVKAVLINSADDLGGAPDVHQGWGRVSLERAVATRLPERVQPHDEGPLLFTGQSHILELQCLEDGLSLKVTLVWTDPPGERLQSDLDLVVERDGGGGVRHGNRPQGATDFDRANNVEQIVWPAFPAGPFRVRVHAHHTLPEGQAFALVIRGGI